MKRAQEDILVFTQEQKDEIIPALHDYMLDAFDVELTGLQGQLLLRYITQNIGKYYYNQAIDDAMASMAQKVDDLYLLVKL